MEYTHPDLQPTPCEHTMAGVQAKHMGTTFGTALHRWLRPEDHTPYNKVTHTIIHKAPMPTVTEYNNDGVPLHNELLHHVEAMTALPVDKLYRATIRTSELNNWLIHIDADYTRLTQPTYWPFLPGVQSSPH